MMIKVFWTIRDTLRPKPAGIGDAPSAYACNWGLVHLASWDDRLVIPRAAHGDGCRVLRIRPFPQNQREVQAYGALTDDHARSVCSWSCGTSNSTWELPLFGVEPTMRWEDPS